MDIQIASISREQLKSLDLEFLDRVDVQNWENKIDWDHVEPIILQATLDDEILGLLLGFEINDTVEAMRFAVKSDEFQEITAYLLCRELIDYALAPHRGVCCINLVGTNIRIVRIFETIGIWKGKRAKLCFHGRELLQMAHVLDCPGLQEL